MLLDTDNPEIKNYFRAALTGVHCQTTCGETRPETRQSITRMECVKRYFHRVDLIVQYTNHGPRCFVHLHHDDSNGGGSHLDELIGWLSVWNFVGKLL